MFDDVFYDYSGNYDVQRTPTWYHFSKYCPDGQRPDSDGYCGTCEDITPGCTECYKGACYVCETEIEGEPYYYPAATEAYPFSLDFHDNDYEQVNGPVVQSRTCDVPDCFVSKYGDLRKCAECYNDDNEDYRYTHDEDEVESGYGQ